MKQQVQPVTGSVNDSPSETVVPRTHVIVLEDLEVMADIGFHAFEVGHPQRLLVTVEVSLDLARWPARDAQDAAWDYDFIRQEIARFVTGHHYNLQERFAEDLFRLIAEKPGVTGLTIRTRKPDVYPDAASVGIVLSSYEAATVHQRR